jgi:hypothetical protein
MSYQPARYANPIFEEMERIFGLDEDLERLPHSPPGGSRDMSRRPPQRMEEE